MIRFATAADIPQILAIYGPYVEHTGFSFEYTVPTPEEMTRRFESYTAQFPWLVWEEDGVVLGYAYGSAPFERAAYRWCAEVSVYLAPELHGRGIGRKLYAVLETLLWKQGYEVIYALITTENRVSLDFHSRLGYKTVATFPDCGLKFGRRLGVVWMEKRQEPTGYPQNFPLPWHAIVDKHRNPSDILDNLTLS
jgi:phosphinothricin acetyltransferase